MRRRRPNRPGRVAEEIVALLEQALGPGVHVASPAFVAGRHSGTDREVDITLRGAVGSVEVLVMIECRDRKARQGVDWIEQLVEKARDVGAGRVIAVSTSGFTESARRLAALKNVLLRTLETLDSDGIARWFPSPRLTAHVPVVRQLLGICADDVLFVDCGCPGGPMRRRDDPLFRFPGLPEPVSLNAIIAEMVPEALAPGLAENARPDGPTPCCLGLSFTMEPLELLVRRAPILLKRLDIGIEVRPHPLPLEFGEARQYCESEGVVAQTAHYDVHWPGGYTRLHVTETPAPGERYLRPLNGSIRTGAAEP